MFYSLGIGKPLSCAVAGVKMCRSLFGKTKNILRRAWGAQIGAVSWTPILVSGLVDFLQRLVDGFEVKLLGIKAAANPLQP